MLTAESLALAHLLPTDRFEATHRLSATAEADQAKFRHSRIDYSMRVGKARMWPVVKNASGFVGLALGTR
jgi:hypothetical protein